MNQAVVALIALAVIGASLIVAGVYILAGAGWALIMAGISAFAAAAYLKAAITVTSRTP